uniref:Pentapeptide repeat-containing protein n=1 Tax=Candidatus Kentrum sp. FW TaxID=2126338 RepID=A0A450SEN1_9GAMM|nr:MAG: Pentapeptide repeat-containing protein [Candidatus Kentron sp. FW]
MFPGIPLRIISPKVRIFSLFLLIIIPASIVLHIFIHTNFPSILTTAFWEENSEWIRNLSLVFAVIIGMFLAVWRNIVSNIASRALAENTKINNKNSLISLQIHSGNLYLECMKNLANHEKEKTIVILHSIIILGRFLQDPGNEEYELAIFALTHFLREIVPYDMRDASKPLDRKNKMERDAVLAAFKKCKTDATTDQEIRLDLANLDLEDADLFGFDLKKTDLMGSNLKGIKLDSADLAMVTLIGVNLEKAHLHKVNFENANLYKANISTARMDKANLRNTDLGRANLSAAYLMESNFQQAKVGNADFTKAVVTNADFEEAWLFEADFEGTVGLTVEQLSKAKTLYGVKSLPSHVEIELRRKHAKLFQEPGSLDFEEI